jgi:Phage protein Gp138 N-terminal domain
MPLEVDMAELIDDAIASRLLDVHTALPGTIKSYDAAKQTADVIPQVRSAAPKQDGSTVAETVPVIPNVPVQWPRGGGMALHFPLAPGDHVLLVFNEAAIGHWRETGEVADPGDLRRHTFGYPVAIPGIAPNASPIADPGSSSEAVLSVGGKTFRVGGASAEMVALANLVQQALDKIQATFDAHTHPVPGITPGPGATVSSPTATLIGTLGPVASSTLKAQ